MFAPRVLIYEQDAYVQTVSQNHKIGTVAETPDGRVFRYGQVGAANISAGKLQLAPVQKTNHHNLTAIAVAAGSQQVTATLGATAAVANEYAGGLVTINVTPGVAQAYEIVSHAAVLSGGIITLNIARPILTAWTTATRISLSHNAYAGVVEGTVQTRRVAGVPMIAMTALYFGWFLTKGVAPVLSDGAIGLGSWAVPSGSVSGALTVVSGTLATAELTNMVAKATIMATVDTEYRPVEFFID